MKKFLLKAVSFTVIVFLAFYSLCFLSFFTGPTAYKDHYQQGFVYQYRAIEREKEKKLVTIGASYIAYEVDSDLMTKTVGMPSYNFGIHAGMGFTYMFETLEPLLKEGDVVVFPYTPFAPNDYGYELIEIALEGQKDLASSFVKNHFAGVMGSIPSFLYRKLYGSTVGKIVDKIDHAFSEVDSYTAASFDQTTGNFIYPRPSAIINHDGLVALKQSFTNDLISEDGVAYLKGFVERCEKKGVTVYFTAVSVCRSSIPQTDEELASYEAYVRARHSFVSFLDVDMLSVSYEDEYYYNTALHLNDRGVERYTSTIANAVNAMLAK